MEIGEFYIEELYRTSRLINSVVELDSENLRIISLDGYHPKTKVYILNCQNIDTLEEKELPFAKLDRHTFRLSKRIFPNHKIVRPKK